MVLMRSGKSVKINRNAIDIENGEDDDATSRSFRNQIVEVLEERDTKWILGLITYNLVIIHYLCSWVTSTNSIALRAYVNTILFNVFALLVCLISIWVEQNSPENREFCRDDRTGSIFGNCGSPPASRYPEYRTNFTAQLHHSIPDDEGDREENPEGIRRGRNSDNITRTSNDERFDRKSISVLGLEKYEVLALLVSSCLSLVAGSLVSVELVTRLTDQPSIHTGRLGLGALLGFLAHLGTIIAYPDAGLNHVVCKALPCPTLRGCNPILGGNVVGAVILSGTHIVIHFWDIHITDTAAAFAVIGLTATSMLPLAFYTLNVILQKLPRHMCDQLDKCLREALIIDGVLEFRNERFWTKSFGKLAGTLQVRIRKNANESHVLENVVQRLSIIVSTLTVQEFRDPRTASGSSEHSAEYYINEILPRDESRRPQHPLDHSPPREIHEDARVVRIEEILGVSGSQVESFAAQPEKANESSLSNDQRGTDRFDLIPTRTLTIYQNDNVRVRDHLYRGDESKKNALLYGAIIDVDQFHNFSVR